MDIQVDREPLYHRQMSALLDTSGTPESRRPYWLHPNVRAEVERILTEVPVSELNVAWLETSLADDEGRWFVVWVCSKASGWSPGDTSKAEGPSLPLGSFPTSMLAALVRAAVLERDPSFNGWFVGAAVWLFGWAATVDALRRYVLEGFLAERMGAVNALYHAMAAWRLPWGPETVEPETLDAHCRAVDEALLTTFLQTTDGRLQQRIVDYLRPVNKYPRDLRHLARRAHEIRGGAPPRDGFSEP
jgi:hypothetical protein